MTAGGRKSRSNDDKVQRILHHLEEGLSREEVAAKFQYTSYRSMDIFMSRKNYKWNKQKGNYALTSSASSPPNMDASSQPDRVRRIITALERGGANLRDAAQKMGFSSHLEMASYMKSKGYGWSEDSNNYVSVAGNSRNDSILHSSSKVTEQEKVTSMRGMRSKKRRRGWI
jgi:hypothetical protein